MRCLSYIFLYKFEDVKINFENFISMNHLIINKNFIINFLKFFNNRKIIIRITMIIIKHFFRCAFCLKEAQFYCCWNTSYCDYPCQQKHWNSHMNTCAQSRNAVSVGNVASSSSDKTKQLTKIVPPNNVSVSFIN